MNMLKIHLRSRLGEKSQSHLMKIAIELPEKLSDSDLENIVDTVQKKIKRHFIDV